MSSRSIFEGGFFHLEKAFFPLSIGVCVIAIVAFQTQLPAPFAIYGLYPIIGLVFGAAIYYFTDYPTETLYVQIDGRWQGIAVYVTIALTVGIVALTDSKLAVLAGLGVGYVLVVHQLFAESDPKRLVPQVTGLFLLSPITKYITSGFYFGHGDILAHVRIAEDVLLGGSLEAISYTGYQHFPGLHLVSAAVGGIAGLSAYDGLLLSGLVLHALVIPSVYLIVSHLTKQSRLGFYTAFGVVILDGFSFFTSYFFPQSFATVLVVVLLLLATMSSRDGIKWGVVVSFVLVAVTLAWTHHLTQLLFAPVFGIAAIFYAFQGRKFTGRLVRSRGLALISFAGALTAFRWIQTGFLTQIKEVILLQIRGGLLGGYTQTVEFSYGTIARSTTVQSALEWLVSPYGIYLILLVLVFSTGVVTFLKVSDRSAINVSLALTGIVAAVLVFETPLSIESLIRIRYPWLFAFAFVLGIGLFELRRRTRPTVIGIGFLTVVILIATFAPLVTADNYYGLDPRPTLQTSFSDQEYQELRATSGYFAEDATSPTVFWRTRTTMERFRVTDLQHPEIRGRTLLLPSGHFIYRTAWSNYKVSFTTTGENSLYSNKLFVSDRWLHRRIMAGNKVYTAGDTGAMWKARERPFEEM